MSTGEDINWHQLGDADDEEQPTDASTALGGRRSDMTYQSARFPNSRANSSDNGQPSRFAYKVFDHTTGEEISVTSGNQYVVTQVGDTRTQVRALVSRAAGNIVEISFERVKHNEKGVTEILRLRRDQARTFINFVKTLDHIDPESDGGAIRVKDQLIASIFADKRLSGDLDDRKRDAIREVVTNDESASDLIAVAHRRKVLLEFERMLDDPNFFKQAQGQLKPEATWQHFFERNPWILGIGLGDQLFTSWDEHRLETTILGKDPSHAGKRPDALLRTAGIVRSMVFAEIKRHDENLLAPGEPYRSDTYAPSKELSGGIAQSQMTAELVVQFMTRRLQSTDDRGIDIPSDWTYIIRPRSFLIIGKLSEFVGPSGGHDQPKWLSFELLRRHTQEPEIITYDELLARARWIVGNS